MVPIHRTEQVSGQSVLVPEEPLPVLSAGDSQHVAESDTREDQSLQRVLHCLQQIACGTTAGEQHASTVRDAEAPGARRKKAEVALKSREADTETEAASTKEADTEKALIKEADTDTETASTKEAATEKALIKEADTETALIKEADTETASTKEADTEAPSSNEADTEAPSSNEAETGAPPTKEAQTKDYAVRIREPMFVITQMNFRNYLDNASYPDATSQLPRPVDLKNQNQDRGDFDVLIIHRHHGILVGEVKSVGLCLIEPQRDTIVAKRLKRAIEQLNKAESVLKYLFSDTQSAPRVRKCVMLPYVTSDCLRRVLEADSTLRQVRM